MNVAIIHIKSINQHEQTNPKNLEKVKKQIEIAGIFKEPIIVDRQSLTVLDGHHRLNSCRQLGLKKIPCVLVDYLSDKKIRVTTRRKNIKINKNIVVKMGLSPYVFPCKTTKHFIPYRVKKMTIPLKKLK